MLPQAPEQTLAQLRAALARAVLAVDPDGAADRHTEARKDRRVYVQPEADGMGSLWALLTASDAAGAYEWLTRLARGLGADDPRSMDARRADLLAALLNGRLVPDADTIVTDDTPDDRAGTDASRPRADRRGRRPIRTARGGRHAGAGGGADAGRVESGRSPPASRSSRSSSRTPR